MATPGSGVSAESVTRPEMSPDVWATAMAVEQAKTASKATVKVGLLIVSPCVSQ
jgi:hypothetical protein